MFLPSEYEHQRQTVIDSFNLYENSRKKLRDSTGQSDGRSEKDLQILKKDVELVAENKYLLTIVGESKSGKSAFINGLLKQQILPTRVLQCTSAILEILDTDNEQSGLFHSKCKSCMVKCSTKNGMYLLP
jgi:ABC-type polysaccharide/polyol phosphate transport system ATPase subunit